MSASWTSSRVHVFRVDLHRRLVAQQLFDERDRQLGFVAEPLQDVGMAEQGEHAVGDEVDGCLVARDQQEPSGGHDVFGGQPFLGGQP